MSGSMKTSGDAAATMFEHASVVSAKIAVIDDRHAVRDVGAVIEEHRASAPGWRPCAETPPEAGVDTNRNSRVKGKAGSPNDTGRRGQHNEARIGDKQRPPDLPRVVIRNANHDRIDRHNLDHAGVYHHTLLRGRN
jgi:hypothetical protein